MLESETAETDGKFWCLKGKSQCFQERIERNEIALAWKDKAKNYTKLISLFPFVRAVFLTGSFSKGVMANDSDLDFFIVTEPGRLWFSKLLMVLFRKLFLGNSHRYFCINYLVSSDNLSIKDVNRFTSMELCTMIPGYGYEYYARMRKLNSWTDQFHPMKELLGKEMMIFDGPHHVWKTRLEWMLKGSWISVLDRKFMERSAKRYQDVYRPELTEDEFNSAIKVGPNVSKVHPRAFQRRVEREYQRRLSSFIKSH